MDLAKGETVFGKTNSLTLTSRRLIQEEESWHLSSHKEIPLHNITSVYYENRSNLALIIWGIIALICSVVFLFFYPRLNLDATKGYIVCALILIAGASLIIVGMQKSGYVIFRSDTDQIQETIDDMQDFMKKFQEEVYKKEE